MKYKLYVPAQAVGANLVYFSFFNSSTSEYAVYITSCIPVVSGAVDVAGALAVDLFLTRTTTVSTGGTAATAEGTSATAMTLTAIDCSQPFPLSQVTALFTPTGGGTAGARLAWRSVFPEETNAGAYAPVSDVVGDTPILVRRGTGFRVIQGAVASVGNIGFDITLKLEAP